MKLGFIGAGQVGGTLAMRFGRMGHSILLGSKGKLDDRASSVASKIGANAQVLPILDAIKDSEVVFLATPWSAVNEIVETYSSALKGKILVDCTNPLKPDLSGLLLAGTESGGEHLQDKLPGTQVIKALNTVGFNIMANPLIEGRKSVMFFCGNDERARAKVHSLIAELGFQPIDAGDISACRMIEPFALLWIKSAYKFGLGREFAFSLIKN